MTTPIDRWAIVTAASASNCRRAPDDGRQPTKGNRNEPRPGVQADATDEQRGAAVSFATKEDAIVYIVSLAPRGPVSSISPW